MTASQVSGDDRARRASCDTPGVKPFNKGLSGGLFHLTNVTDQPGDGHNQRSRCELGAWHSRAAQLRPVNFSSRQYPIPTVASESQSGFAHRERDLGEGPCANARA
jgi:hypothetical protein